MKKNGLRRIAAASGLSILFNKIVSSVEAIAGNGHLYEVQIYTGPLLVTVSCI